MIIVTIKKNQLIISPDEFVLLERQFMTNCKMIKTRFLQQQKSTNWWKWNVPILSTEVEYWKKHYHWTNFLSSCIMKSNIALWSHTILHMWHAIAHGGIINVFFRLPLRLRRCNISPSFRQTLYLSNQSEIGPLLSHPVWYLAQTLRV